VALHAVRQQARLVLPLVAEHEVDVAERERGQSLLRLELDQLASEPRRVARERPHGGQRQAQRHRLEAGDPGAPGHRSGGRRELGLGHGRAVEQRLGVAGEDERGVGEPHAAPRALEQPYARLALEECQLLGDGRRRELERVGHRRDRPAVPQLPEEAEAAKLQHR
jgi:hypothetical protein